MTTAIRMMLLGAGTGSAQAAFFNLANEGDPELFLDSQVLFGFSGTFRTAATILTFLGV